VISGIPYFYPLVNLKKIGIPRVLNPESCSQSGSPVLSGTPPQSPDKTPQTINCRDLKKINNNG